MTNESSLKDIREHIGQPRTYEMMINELNDKLSSKGDWYDYLTQHK